MNIPDPMVYASLPILGGAAVWIGQQFVQSVIFRNRDDPKTSPERRERLSAMTVQDYRQISELLKQELNGRYMFAKEARERFGGIENKIEHLGEDMKAFISERVPSNRTV
jgi:hypothetical protein